LPRVRVVEAIVNDSGQDVPIEAERSIITNKLEVEEAQYQVATEKA